MENLRIEFEVFHRYQLPTGGGFFSTVSLMNHCRTVLDSHAIVVFSGNICLTNDFGTTTTMITYSHYNLVIECDSPKKPV